MRPVIQTNILTLNRFQFFGIITREYLDQIAPVAVREADCETLILSAGRAKSPMPAITRHHLQAGAQKNIVLGPAG